MLKLAVATAVFAVAFSTLAEERGAKVTAMRGSARYHTGDNQWRPVKEGDVLHTGAVIQTASGSSVDLLLDGYATPLKPSYGPPEGRALLGPVPIVTANMVRLYENTTIAFDKLTCTDTGADTVTETQIDLRKGKLFGTAKKITGASKYEVRVPNGVAAIRGTIWTIDDSGKVNVLSGTVVITVSRPGEPQVVYVVSAGNSFDPATGAINALPGDASNSMSQTTSDLGAGGYVTPAKFQYDNTINFVSPTVGDSPGGGNGNGNGNGDGYGETK